MRLRYDQSVFVVHTQTGELSEMTLNGWVLAVQGGADWNQYELYTSREEASVKSQQYTLAYTMAQRLRQVSPADALSILAQYVVQANVKELQEWVRVLEHRDLGLTHNQSGTK